MAQDPEKPKQATWGQRLALWGYRALCGLLKITDVRLVALFGRSIGYLVWAASPSRRRIVARNLRIVVDPTLREKKLRPMVRRNMVRTTMNLACSLKTGLMSDREAKRSIRMDGADLFEASGMDGRTVISCIPHAGNWEILARIRPYFPRVEHFGSMYRRMSNPLLEKCVYQARTKYGCEMFSKEEGLKAVLRLARSGGLLGILSDQFTQEGIFLPYFGKITGVTPLPALLYKRCKGKGQLFSVFTRNTGLGRWEAVLGRPIPVPEGVDSLPGLTMLVNKALEKCQKENILDGFWMHHRWKATAVFAPKQEADVAAVAKEETRLPFRIIIAVPEAFEEAALLVPALRILKACRHDIQLTVLCPSAQKAWWQSLPQYIAYVVASNAGPSPVEQLESDELYKDGPYDYLFMFSDNKRVFKNLQKLRPIFIAGFADNPLSRHFRCRYAIGSTGPIRHRVQDYVQAFSRYHKLGVDIDGLAAPLAGNPDARGAFIAPFSTLGKADSWPEEKWAELVCALGHATLLAFKENETEAQGMAQRIGIGCRLTQPEELASILGPQTRLYAVDGLLPLLASYTGCPCTVIMASRLTERYGLTGEQHRSLNNHLPCHPCYAKSCDMPERCTASISASDMLG